MLIRRINYHLISATFIMICCSVFLLTGCGTTGSGVNRSLLFNDTNKVELPYKLNVQKNGVHSEVGTIVDDGLSTSSFFLIGGLGGIVGGKGMQATGIQSAMRGKFMADEAFEDIVKKISFAGNDSSPIINLELTKFQPLLKCGPKNKKLILFMEFMSTIADTNKAVNSRYIFEYTISSMDFFVSSKEKDMLREMVEYALNHWARKLSVQGLRNDDGLDFPVNAENKLNFESLECSYNIFSKKWD